VWIKEDVPNRIRAFPRYLNFYWAICSNIVSAVTAPSISIFYPSHRSRLHTIEVGRVI
jgi:hypothetical protein